MTQDEVIEMARQAGFSDWAVQTPNDLLAFAKLVAEKEREACAKRLETVGCDHCAENIRARGQA